MNPATGRTIMATTAIAMERSTSIAANIGTITTMDTASAVTTMNIMTNITESATAGAGIITMMTTGTRIVTAPGGNIPPMSADVFCNRDGLGSDGNAMAEKLFLNPTKAEAPTGERVTRQAQLNAFLTDVQQKAYHVAWGALWDRETALDVVQESMMRFVEYYGDKPDKEWPALFRTVLNSKINDQRRRRLLNNTKRKLLLLTGMGQLDPDETEKMLEADLPAGQHDEGISDPEAGVTGKQLKQHITRALAKLAERQRQVFLLREQLGLSIRNTAEILGCSENSVKQHHFRALRALRGILAEVWEHEQA